MKNAAIIGCGNIAGFLDRPFDENVLTHAHAYAKHPNTKLIAVCDPSVEQRNKFISRWGNTIHHYDNIQDLLDKEDIDILSICSPTPFHFEAMLQALQDKNIKTIICEKPFVDSQEELQKLLPLIEKSDKKIMIDFLRRYDPSIRKVHELILTKELGEIQCFNGKFTKGLYHNGSHMLELIEHLCGDITYLCANDTVFHENDLYGNFYLKTESYSGTLQNFSGDNYALFEFEIIFSKGRVLIKNSGHSIQIETIEPSKQYEGYFALEHTCTLEDTMQMNLLNAINFALDSTSVCLKEHLRLSKKLLDIKNNLQNQQILHWEHL